MGNVDTRSAWGSALTRRCCRPRIYTYTAPDMATADSGAICRWQSPFTTISGKGLCVSSSASVARRQRRECPSATGSSGCHTRPPRLLAGSKAQQLGIMIRAPSGYCSARVDMSSARQPSCGSWHAKDVHSCESMFALAASTPAGAPGTASLSNLPHCRRLQ